jgi:RHS repeat-associated protein
LRVFLSRGRRAPLTFPFLASVWLALCGFGAPAEGSYGVLTRGRGPDLVTLDPEGHRTSTTTPKGTTTAFEYDELGKLTKVTQPAVLVHGSGGGAPTLQAPVTTYSYDENRNRVLQTDANLHSVKMEYDELNRLKKTIQDPRTPENPTGLNLVIETIQFDENGNPLVVRDPKGQTITSTFDELNRLKTKSYAFAPGDTIRPWRYTVSIDYGYDENGNLLTTDENVASGTDPPEPPLRTVREYDRLDRLTKETQPLSDRSSREVRYTYYRNGLRKTVTDPAESVTQYAYDGQNRLETATTGFGGAEAATTRYTYWPDDLLHTVSYPNVVVATHDYDKADRLLTLANAKGETPVSSYTYSSDPNGNRLSQVEVNGLPALITETTTYTYDDLDRLASVTYPVDAAYPQGRVVSYGYDAVGNRVRETERDSAEALLADKQGVFDAANRLTELQDLVTPAQSTSFTWDANGNQLTKTTAGVTTENRYDLRDKLVEVVQGASTLGRFQYDAQGRRNLKIGDENLRQYVYDETSLFAEFDSAGNQKAKYDYGSDRLISLTRPGDEGRRYFSLDGLRSVVNLTDDSGAAVASYHLDTWGNFRFPTELTASANRFAFTGHIFDTETGLYDAKARYFDPKLGRFLTQDSFLGDIDEPPSLHRYLYANANPTTLVDPTGHIARQMLDESINRSTDQSSNWFTAGAKAFFKEASYQTLDVISFGALHRQDKLVDQNLAGQISDAEYYGKTGVNVALSGTQAAMTLGTGGAMGATRTAAVAWGAAGGIAGQGISDIGEVYGTETKNLEDVRARDYLLAGAMGAAGGYAGYRARGPARAGPSQAEKAGVIAEHGQSATPEMPAPAAAAAPAADVNVQPAIKPPSQTAPSIPAAAPAVAGPSRATAFADSFVEGGPASSTFSVGRTHLSAPELQELMGQPGMKVTGTTGAGAARPPRHHVFTQENRSWFQQHGVDIDRYTLELTQGEHTAAHSMGWNKEVQSFIDQEALWGRTYSRREVLRFGAQLRREFGLRHHKVVPFAE